MGSFFEELRDAREAKKISLQHISDVTLINLRYLDAIEKGDVSVLPQAYVRAFLREYAAVIGLDPDQTMKRYDGALEAGAATGAPAPATQAGPTEPGQSAARTLLMRSKGTPAIAGVVVLATVIVLYLVGRSSQEKVPTRETPFPGAVRENESRIAAPAAGEGVPKASPPVSAKDSLRLTASITDSLWLQIAIDEQPPREYLFPPSRKASWKAERRFLVTLGNAGAAEFTLDEKSLGRLGQSGAVVRNIEISRKNLSTQQ